MIELENIIKEKGQVLPGDVLKIDNFLNHQIDVKVMDMIGREFYSLFKNELPNKILTIESSGIAIAMATSYYFGSIPIVFAKKTDASNMAIDTYKCLEKSYTRGIEYNVQVSREYLNENDRVLILDDFLANGEAMNSLINICLQAKVKIVGLGTVVSKAYQPGEERIKRYGYHLESLARVKKMDSIKSIEFEHGSI